MFPASLHALAFIICLGVQSMNSPLAGAWLLFHIAGCAALLYNGKYNTNPGMLWYVCVVWNLTLGVSAFLFMPVYNGAATMWVLLSMPSLALCLRKEYLRPYCMFFFSIILAYALGLILQMVLKVEYDHYNIGARYAWPMLDPNNAAAIVNLALVPCIYLTLFKDVRWALLCGLFAIALYATGSKAGVGAAGAALLIFSICKYGAECAAFWLAIGIIQGVAAFFYAPDIILIFINALSDRFPIWETSWDLILLHPWTGLGLGLFGKYYQMYRTEQYTGGWFAHNDLLQITAEMGIPCGLIFCILIGTILFTTRRSNLVSGVTLLAIILESMVEFQFYVPAVSMGMGLALGCHILNRQSRGTSRRQRSLYRSI